MWAYKDKAKIEDEIGIMSTFSNELKLMLRLKLNYMLSVIL